MSGWEITGFYPGLIGDIVKLHGSYYSAHWNFDQSFEIQVARELADFAAHFQPGRDGVWAARKEDLLGGALLIDGRNAQAEGARLRWFIVSPEHQGHGLGWELLQRSVTFCRKKDYPKIFLWTVKGLDAARKLYVKVGFEISQEHALEKWGLHLVEQKYEITLA